MADDERDDERDDECGPIAPKVSGLWVVARRLADGVLYQQEMVRCGKRRTRKDGSEWVCPCMTGGKLHGPYWYAYHTARGRGGRVAAGGRWVRSYIGRDLAP